MVALAFRVTTQWREKGQALPMGSFFFKTRKGSACAVRSRCELVHFMF